MYDRKTRPTSTPAEPVCEYDHPDIIAAGPKGRIARLEARLAEVEALLETANEKLLRCTCNATADGTTFTNEPEPMPAYSTTSREAFPSPPSFSEPPPLPRHGGAYGHSIPLTIPNKLASGPPPIQAFFLPPSPWNTAKPPPLPNLSMYASQITSQDTPSDSFDVCPSSWPLNIPPPAVLYHLVEIFFSSVPLAGRLIHKPTFMSGLRQLPTSPDFPNVALLHAICGIASLYSPIITDSRPDPPKAHFPLGSFNSAIVFRPDADSGVQGKHYFPKTLNDIIDRGEEGFGASHIRWAAASLRLSVREGDRLLQLVQATIICTWYTYSRGMSIAVYMWMGSVIRLLTPLGFYVSEGFEPLSRLPSKMLFIFGKPKSHVEAETIRNVFWITYVMERVYSAGNAWPLIISDEEISQMMPCRFSDFMAGERVPTHGRQRIFTENMLLSHPPLATDSWTLYIKASILISRVRSFNCLYNIRTGSRKQPDAENYLSEKDVPIMPSETEEFALLDQTIAGFLTEIPRAFREPVGTTVDPLLYMVHILPHVAMIQLHDPHANIASPNDHSAARVLSATRAILDLMYKVCGTTYDLLFMDHSCSFCWFVCGAALVRFLKAKIDAKDQDEAERLEQELGVVKFMLKNLGERATVGARQLRLLNEIYDIEIKGHGRGPPRVPTGTGLEPDNGTDNWIFGNMRP